MSVDSFITFKLIKIEFYGNFQESKLFRAC